MCAIMEKNAFSLIEVLIAILLVGLAIAALVITNSTLSNANSAATDLSTAEFLIEQIRELTALLPVVDPQTGSAVFGPEAGETLSDYDDLDDFDNTNFSPPINTDRDTLNNFVDFSQQVTVENVSDANFAQVVGDHGSDFVRVTVKVFMSFNEISSASWLRANIDD